MKNVVLLIVLAALVAATASAQLPRPRFHQEVGSYHPEGIPYSSTGTRYGISAQGNTIYVSIWFQNIVPNGYGGAGGYAWSQALNALKANPLYNRVRVTISYVGVVMGVPQRLTYTRTFIRS